MKNLRNRFTILDLNRKLQKAQFLRILFPWVSRISSFWFREILRTAKQRKTSLFLLFLLLSLFLPFYSLLLEQYVILPHCYLFLFVLFFPLFFFSLWTTSSTRRHGFFRVGLEFFPFVIAKFFFHKKIICNCESANWLQFYKTIKIFLFWTKKKKENCSGSSRFKNKFHTPLTVKETKENVDIK